MDETDTPQSPAELLLILAALADAGVPLSTIAPKFTGRFNKGVDYVGDPRIFARELEQDMAVGPLRRRRIRTPCRAETEPALRQRQIFDLRCRA